MRRTFSIILLAVFLIASAGAAYDPYPAATGFRRPYHHSWHDGRDTVSYMPGDTMIRIVASTHGLDLGRARLAAVLYAYSYLASDPSLFHGSEEEFLSSLLYDMRRSLDGWTLTRGEDRAIRDLSDRLTPFLSPSRRDRWTDLRWAIEDSFLRLIERLRHHDIDS